MRVRPCEPRKGVNLLSVSKALGGFKLSKLWLCFLSVGPWEGLIQKLRQGTWMWERSAGGGRKYTELALRARPLICPCRKHLLSTYWIPSAAQSQDLLETKQWFRSVIPSPDKISTCGPGTVWLLALPWKPWIRRRTPHNWRWAKENSLGEDWLPSL